MHFKKIIFITEILHSETLGRVELFASVFELMHLEICLKTLWQYFLKEPLTQKREIAE